MKTEHPNKFRISSDDELHLFGNVNDREWSVNGRKYPLGGDGLSANVLYLSADVRQM